MKRTLPLLVLIGVVGLLVPVLAVFGKPPAEAGCVSCSSSIPVAKSPSDNDRVIDELTAILKETKSAETFLVTAMVLGRMGPEAKRALPIIIRNAERLELFEDLYKANAAAENRAAAQEIVAALEMILDKKAGANGRTWRNPTPACYAPAPVYGTTPPACAPASLASPNPPTSWNAPLAVPPPPTPSTKPAKPAQPIAPSTN
jgi:hypothetical protein